MQARPELDEKAKSLSYAKYYYLPLTPIPLGKLAVLEAGPMDASLALPIEKRNDLFLPGYLPGETGFCVLDNGTGYLSNLTKMPGVTPDMFNWWFAWHALEDTRYRIWDPEDHFYARQQNPARILDPQVPLLAKNWGTTHLIKEDIGDGAEEIVLNFRYPHELGFQEELVGTDACAGLMCANGHGPVPHQGPVIIMTHFIREIENGIELRSRFWFGYGYINGEIVKVLPEGVQIPLAAVESLFAHNLKEFTHLTAILPLVYAEECDRW